MSWLRRAVIYQIFIDRFAGYDPNKDWNSSERMGGNLRGIIDTFGYIRSLAICNHMDDYIQCIKKV